MLKLQIIVTGMHLSPEFGFTFQEIEKEFTIDKKIEILLSSDTSVGTSKSMGLAQISFAESYVELQPDIVLVLGDRYEIFSAVLSAMVMNIPIAHLSGGEVTSGAIDDAIRHAITKMSHLHFVATDEYKKRVIQLGENADYIFNFGEAGLDNLERLTLLSRDEFEKSINFKLNEKNLLVTFHPVTLERIDENEKCFLNILNVLGSLKHTSIIFTKTNSDSGGRLINRMIDEYVGINKSNSIAITSLGQLRYLSALQFIDGVIGNSSSGIVEAPSFKVGTINIGNRQNGRVQAESVINSSNSKEDIEKSLKVLYSKDFIYKLKGIVNPYWKPNASLKTKEILKGICLDGLVNKKFIDIK